MNLIYSVMVFICILIMFVLCMFVKCSTTQTKESKKWFIITFIGIAVGISAEFTRSVLDIYPISNDLYRVITFIEFSVTPLLPIPLSLACGIKKPALYTGVILLVHVLVELVLLPTGFIFTIDSNGIYSRGDLYFIYIISYVISIFYLILSYYYISKKFQNRNLILLILALVVIFAGVIPSLIDREIKTAFLGMTFMAVIIYCYYEDLTQQNLNDKIHKKNERIKNMQTSTIIGIANLIESRDNVTGEHVKNTSNYVHILAETARYKGLYSDTITEDFVNYVVNAAPLHDIGKITIPDSVLHKPNKLTTEEFNIIKTHTTEGGKIIKQVLSGVTDYKYVKIATEVAIYHHEKWNGSGYPEGLKGEEIPVSARIMAICDVYDALTMERPYKKAFTKFEALKIISDTAGKHFDPELAKLFVEVMLSNK